MKSLLIFCLLLNCHFLYSQTTSEDDYLDSIWTLSKSNPTQALEQGHSLFANLDSISSNHQKRRVFWKYLGLHRKVFKHDTLLAIYNANKDKYLLSETGARDTLTGFLMYEEGTGYWKTDQTPKAVEIFQNLNDLGEELEFKKFELYSTFGIALIYEGQAMSDEALPLYERSYEIGKELENTIYQINAIKRIASIHRNEGRIDTAGIYYMKAKDLADSIDLQDKTVRLRTISGVGLNLIDKGQYKEALKYYIPARNMAIEAESDGDLYYIDQAVSYLYQQLYGEEENPVYLDSAIYYSESMLKYSQKMKQAMLISATYRTIAYLEEKKNNYRKALETWPKILQWRDSALTENAIRDVRELREKYETEKKEQQIVLQQEKLEKESLIRNGLISGSILLLVIAGLVINRQKLSIKNKAREKELTELKLSKTKDELTLREQELLTYVITISQKNNLLHNVKEVAKKADDLPDANSRLKKINVEIENGYSLSQQWEEFRQRFEKIHVKFFDKLAEFASDFTNTDRRICAYLKLGLSSKQIANLQNVSVETVEVRRSQIRKKLQLSKEDNLSTFIMGIK